MIEVAKSVPLVMVARPPSTLKKAGTIQWRCPNCDQRMGDVIGDRLVIQTSDRRWSVPVRNGIDQTCPRCGTLSELRLL